MKKVRVNFSENFLPISVLLVLWIAGIFFIDPLHDFPLNDSWSFAQTVQTLVEEGHFELNDWMGSTFLAQALMGALFCWPFGFSFDALTISTLFASVVALVFTYLLFTRLCHRVTAFIFTLMILVNPMFINLSVTYMMDVHFLAFFISSIYFYLRFYERKRLLFLALGIFLSLVAIFIRQYGIVVPLSFLLFEILIRRNLKTQLVIIHASSVIVFFIFLALYKNWLVLTDNFPRDYRSMTDLFYVPLTDYGWRVFTRTGLLFLESGMWLLPVLIPLTLINLPRGKESAWPLLVFSILFLPPMVRMVPALPAGNIFYDFGLGPITTRDIYLSESGKAIFNLPWIMVLFRIIAFSGGVMVLFNGAIGISAIWREVVMRSAPATATGSFRAIFVIIILLYAAINMINFTYFDRYLLPLLPVILIFLYPGKGDSVFRRSLFQWSVPMFIALYFAFGVLATKDYLRLNRMRWKAAEELMNRGVKPQEIDGGHEFNGWYGKEIDPFGRWDTTGFRYVITFQELPGYRIDKTYDLKSWLTGRNYKVRVLEKANFQEDKIISP